MTAAVEEPQGRTALLEAAAARIRVRPGMKVPVEQILLVAAAILFPMGILLIILGWEGAAHTGRLYAQIDYLISGGLLGIGLTVAGGFMYFGYWLSRQLGESRRQNALTLQALRRLEDAMEAGFTTVVAAGDAAGSGAANGGSTRGGRQRATGSRGSNARRPGAAPMLVATPNGSLLHRPDCPIVVNRQGVRPLPAGTEGFGYCSMCNAAAVVEGNHLVSSFKEDV